MSTPNSSAGNNIILWAVTALIGLNLIIAWRYSKSDHGTPSTQTVASSSPGVPHAKADDHGTNATPAAAPSEPNKTNATAAAEQSPKPAPASAEATASAASVVPGGDRIRGKVLLKGTPPPEKVITPISKDKDCGKVYSTPPPTRNYVTGSDGGLANVFVHIKSGLAGKKFDPPTAKTEVDQKGCLYEPYVLGVMAGQTVMIKNLDPFMHNVNFPASKAGNPPFNFSQATAGLVNEKAFPKPEVFAKLICNVHPWMACFVGVAESPYFAVTGPDGSFSFPTGLPAGDYVLEAVHPRAGAVQQALKIGADGGATVTLELAVAAAP
jgi:hypothetical protein